MKSGEKRVAFGFSLARGISANTEETEKGPLACLSLQLQRQKCGVRVGTMQKE